MSDPAAIITALGGLITAAGWAYSQIRNRRAIDQGTAQVATVAAEAKTTAVGAKTSADAAHAAASATLEAVGPSNGVNLNQLVGQVAILDQYTHDAIHNLTGKIEVVTALAPTLLDRLDTIGAKVDALAGEAPKV